MENDIAETINNSKSHSAMRTAKCALLLFSLKSHRHLQEKEMMIQTIENLKKEAVKERYKRRNLKLFNLLEFTVLIVLFISVFTFFIFVDF